jgi:hypothetical protein
MLSIFCLLCIQSIRRIKNKINSICQKRFQVAYALWGDSCAGNTCDPLYNLVCKSGICECLSSAYWMNFLYQCGNE